MNNSTRLFNGTRDGSPYQARVTRYVSSESKSGNGHFIVDVIIFNKTTGEPHYSFERNYYDTQNGQRKALRDVIANPDNY
jgi:hypothetical protein